jgi:protein gp37
MVEVMAERSNIEWCDATFNPWIGCTKISPACDHCYAERGFDLRRHVVQWGAGQARKRTSASNWKHPGRWNKRAFYECASCGTRSHGKAFMDAGPNMGITDTGQECPACGSRDMEPARMRVFCASLADVFDNEVPAEWRAELFALIANTPNLDWLLLTKRIGNVARMIEAPGMQKCGLPANVWLGATICNQAEADRDIPKLLATPAAVRFVSIEPMLGPIDLTDIVVRHSGGTEDHFSALYDSDDDEADTASYLDWVICGGESGPRARPMHPQWARDLRDQCAAARVPFLFKQWGEWTPEDPGEGPHSDCAGVLPNGETEKYSDGYQAPFDTMERLEKSGGVRLDGRTLMFRVGKKAGGRLLDGVEHNGFPEVRT